jgi:hypothetical protein
VRSLRVASLIRSVLAASDHHFQVLAGNDQRIGPGLVQAVQQIGQIVLQHQGFVGGQGGEGLVHRAIPGAKDFDEVRGRAVAEVEQPCVTAMPAARSLNSEYRCASTPQRLEQLADKACGRPVGQADAPAGPADPRQL